jgi:glycosyltransferase involved in cell wall biosynthesis
VRRTLIAGGHRRAGSCRAAFFVRGLALYAVTYKSLYDRKTFDGFGGHVFLVDTVQVDRRPIRDTYRAAEGINPYRSRVVKIVELCRHHASELRACGLPVIVGNSGGSAESLIEDVTGYCIDPQSEQELINKINILLSDDELRKKMGTSAREFVEKNHSYDYLASLLVPLVQGDFSSAKSIAPK